MRPGGRARAPVRDRRFPGALALLGRSRRWGCRSATSPTSNPGGRPAACHRRRVDLRTGHPLQARHRRAERVPAGLTTLLFAAATLASNLRTSRETPLSEEDPSQAGSSERVPPERPRLFYFHFMLAESAVLGAFLAQDLALFVAFFDLMLIPFYFLIGGWGREPGSASRRRSSSSSTRWSARC